MSFWDNVSGNAADAYTKTFADVLPNNTTALAQIVTCKNKEFSGIEYINIEWEIKSGDFTGQHIFHKLQVHDKNEDKALKARNMLKFLFVLFHVKPTDNNPPTDNLLSQLSGKVAGIKIQEWSMSMPDGSTGHGNFVSEVHAPTDFVTATGKYREFKLTPPKGYDSALTRNSRNSGIDTELDDDVPF
jgi:hypothetical protein